MSTLRETGAPRLADWPEQACAGRNPAWFFPLKEYASKEERFAKALCWSCAARRQCLAYALPIVDLAGVWGGMNANERTRARKKQQKEQLE